jgi:hypothetical protein
MYLPTRSLGPPTSIGEGDKARSIKVATWILLGVTIAVFIARQIMKAVVFRTVALDDVFICAATVCGHKILWNDYANMLRFLP